MTGTVLGVQGKSPLILDFDDSVLPLGMDEVRIPMKEWQESVRFGCSWSEFSRLEVHVHQVLPEEYGCVFLGSGDFHHLTLLLLRMMELRALAPETIDLVALDNHPDNMRYPFGLHCGSWVFHAAAMPFIRHVHVLGICSADITWPHAWENRLTPFLRRKLTYWSVGRRADWLGLIGCKDACHTFPSADALLDAFLPIAGASPRLYLSVDKDVLAPSVVRTNWDQGVFSETHLTALMETCREVLAGVDVCGDVSEYAYQSRFKRFLSRLDGQHPLAPEQVQIWQTHQQDMNTRLLKMLLPH